MVKAMPDCRAHRDCFANRGGACICLKDNNFGGNDCPFYKAADTAPEEGSGRKHGGGMDYGNQQV